MKGIINYDIALIRLINKLDLPKDNCANEPINSVCFFTNQGIFSKLESLSGAQNEKILGNEGLSSKKNEEKSPKDDRELS